MRRSVPLLILLCLLGGCAAAPRDDAALVGEPFYEELGGRQGIENIVDAFLSELARDERIVDRFAQTDIQRFRRLLIEQFCSLSGGPCEYSGDSMRAVHRTQDIRPDEFDALVRDLRRAMEQVGVPQAARNRLLGRLAPMYRDIVGG
ncbi:MAG: group 1 truncated hemoglobin [Gammaproteobacteria bacterium]|nr:group 1 truncated hemoglobin [Gammaproteobacteria bacterium]